MKYLGIILLFVLYNVVSGVGVPKKCNTIDNTVSAGEKVVDKVFQKKTQTAKKVANSASIDAILKLKKFTTKINELVKNDLRKTDVDNLREFVKLINSTSNNTIDQVQKYYNYVAFAKIVEDTLNEYQKDIMGHIKIKSVDFRDFLDQHNEIKDCASSKYQFMLSTLITNLKQDIPDFITAMENLYNTSLIQWQNKITATEIDFIKSFEDCKKSAYFKCCIDDFIAGKGFIILKDIDLKEEIQNIVANILNKFDEKGLKAISTIEQNFTQLYQDISQKCK